MLKYRLDSTMHEVTKIELYKASLMPSLVARKAVKFVQHGSAWLLEAANGKLFTNVLNTLTPAHGSFLQYRARFRPNHYYVYATLIELLSAGKYISKLASTREKLQLKEWKEKEDTRRQFCELERLAEKLGVTLTGKQKEILRKGLKE